MLERYEVSGDRLCATRALRGHFARQLDPIKQQAVAREVQVRARQVTRYVPLGQVVFADSGKIQYSWLSHYAYDRVLEYRKS
jgi:hypothetical protein